MAAQPSMNGNPMIRIPVSPVAVSDDGQLVGAMDCPSCRDVSGGPVVRKFRQQRYPRRRGIRAHEAPPGPCDQPCAAPLCTRRAGALRRWRSNSSPPGRRCSHQLRTGKGGRRFRMYKLRTMVRNAEELKAQLMHLNELTYPDFKITNDPRVTRVGWFLRKTSLDELPQLFNVIRGDMSLVGPRPTSFSAGTYSLWHTARLEVKPGLTGLWQISGTQLARFRRPFAARYRIRPQPIPLARYPDPVPDRAARYWTDGGRAEMTGDLLLAHPVLGDACLACVRLRRVSDARGPRRKAVSPPRAQAGHHAAGIADHRGLQRGRARLPARLENALELDYPPEALRDHRRLGRLDGCDPADRANGSRLAECACSRCRAGARSMRSPKPHVVPTGEILVFSDANSMYDRRAIAALAQNFADPEVGGVAGHTSYSLQSGQ